MSISERHHFFRSTILIGSLTFVSRLLGIVRDIVCANMFGGELIWDAFSFAFRIPNLFRAIFGEGALNAAFIPVFTEYIELQDRPRAWRLAWVVLTGLTAVLVACLLVGESLLLLLPRFAHLTERWQLALMLTAVMLPYMVFICLTAVAGAALNGIKHFAAPAFAPVLMNGFWIVAVAIVAPLLTNDLTASIYILAAAIVVSGLFQVMLQFAIMFRKGFPWTPVFDLKDPGLRRISLAIAPVVIGLAAVEVNVVLDGVIAISLSAPPGKTTFNLFGFDIAYPMQVGANSALYYGNRLVQFPLGVFGIALGTAAFPTLSTYAARKEWKGFSQAVNDGLGAVLFIGLPAGVGLMLLGRPAVELLFERGAFTAEMSARTTAVNLGYCAGLWAYCALQVLARSFYSLQDTRTPRNLAGAMVAVNLVLNLTLVWFMAEAGLALATAISAAAQSVILYLILRKRVQLAGQSRLLATLLKTCIATCAMTIAILLTLEFTMFLFHGGSLLAKTVRLCVPLAIGAAAFLVVAALLRTPETSLLFRALKRIGARARS